MLLYHGMYNIAHFEINNSVPLYTNTAVGDAYDYKRLRKVCFESGGAYINDSVIDGGHVRGGAHVTIQEDSIFLNIVPEDPNAGIVYGLTFFMGADERTMYVYAEKREGGGGGESGVHSFNGRRGSVVSASGDYDAGMVSYANDDSGLVADDVQSAIDELAYENENLSDDVEDLQTAIPSIQSDLASAQTAIGALQTNVGALQVNVSALETNVGAIGEDVEDLQEDVTAMAAAIASKPDNLVDLNDVAITTPTDGQVLKYNSASQKWENGAGGGGGASALNDLSDVTIANPSSGQALLYDGTKWENANLPAPPTVPDELNDLSDVDITSPSSGQVLKFNGTDWVNANESGGGTDLSKVICPVETSAIASMAHGSGSTFIDAEGYHSMAISSILVDDPLTLNSNYIRVPVDDKISPLVDSNTIDVFNNCSTLEELTTAMYIYKKGVGYIGSVSTHNNPLRTLLTNPSLGNYATVYFRFLHVTDLNHMVIEAVAIGSAANTTDGPKHKYIRRQNTLMQQTAWVNLSSGWA